MNILYTVDNNFVPQLGAGICSVCENNTRSDIVFYVFSNGITPENIGLLKDLVKRYHQQINIIDIDGFQDWLGFDFDTTGWNEIVLARLIMARLLPPNIDRILYLDGDTIVRGDLSTLWETDFSERTVGMVIEPTVDPKRLELMGLKDRPYFNAGVLFVNLKEWRTRDAEGRLLECCQTKQDLLFANDQDAINITLADEILPLSPTYNYCNSFDIYPYRTLRRLMPAFADRETFDEAHRSPKIVHYLGEERPWRQGNTHRFRDDWRRYLSLTPWADTPQEQGWGTYFVLWRIFNTVTKPFPMTRWRIMTKLIPKFISLRSRKRRRASK